MSNEENKKPEEAKTEEKKEKTPEEIRKERIAELRKRDPFIYR